MEGNKTRSGPLFCPLGPWANIDSFQIPSQVPLLARIKPALGELDGLSDNKPGWGFATTSIASPTTAPTLNRVRNDFAKLRSGKTDLAQHEAFLRKMLNGHGSCLGV